ncbi:hypothetical protein [Streptomyces geranii]|uniref:hypothetical protein n=1 Tax=Streptomyces geranii TaxID=2058923 RepID=UPI001300941E|nr:hypothetical protein [Streptomyces geranii]
MQGRTRRALLLSAILSASLVLGASPASAMTSPSDIGVSDEDWAQIAELGEYNNALTTFVDDSGEITLVFTGGHAADDLQYPDDFELSDPDIVLYGEFSQFDTNEEVDAIQVDTVDQIATAGYTAVSTYNPDVDVVDVVTTAPSDVTDPLVSTYDSKIRIIEGEPEANSAPGGTAHDSAKKHHAKKHHAKKHSKKHSKHSKKHAAKKPASKKHASAKSAKSAKKATAAATRKVTKVVLTPAKAH